MYRDLGFKRIILGREVHLRDIATIKREVPDVEIEVFAHGAMCLAYSGRCFLSSYMADRSANQGTCSHPCRWRYRLLEEEKRPGEYYPVIENDGFTTILSSKDLCMIDHLDALRDAGVDAIKIEGRMKSLYYTALVTRAYRKALDVLEHGQGELIEPYKQELYKVSHREFTTGFYFEDNNVHHPTLDSYIREYQFLGTIGEPVSDGYYKVTVRNRIFRDDVIEYIGPDILYREDHSFELYNEKGEPLEVVHHGMPCYLKTEVPIKPGYIIRKKVTL
jgi:putative protease